MELAASRPLGGGGLWGSWVEIRLLERGGVAQRISAEYGVYSVRRPLCVRCEGIRCSNSPLLRAIVASCQYVPARRGQAWRVVATVACVISETWTYQ